MTDRVCMARFASRVSAGGVVGPESHFLFPLQQLLQELMSHKADCRKFTVNIKSLLHLLLDRNNEF